MTLLDPKTPVGRWVSERPGLAPVFERLGIDYCCSGKVPLERACAGRGLDIAEVLRDLSNAEIAADHAELVGASIPEMVDHIVTVHHAYLRRELPRLVELVDRVRMVHQPRHSELAVVRERLLDFKDDLTFHMLKEERVLFPALVYLESGRMPQGLDVREPIRIMESEHTEAGAALALMRDLTNDFTAPTDACDSYRALLDGLAELEADLHLHVHEENEILFPKALELVASVSRRRCEDPSCA
jgi:regulator of cell morphogenesis and NO signaling